MGRRKRKRPHPLQRVFSEKENKKRQKKEHPKKREKKKRRPESEKSTNWGRKTKTEESLLKMKVGRMTKGTELRPRKRLSLGVGQMKEALKKKPVTTGAPNQEMEGVRRLTRSQEKRNHENKRISQRRKRKERGTTNPPIITRGTP